MKHTDQREPPETEDIVAIGEEPARLREIPRWKSVHEDDLPLLVELLTLDFADAPAGRPSCFISDCVRKLATGTLLKLVERDARGWLGQLAYLEILHREGGVDEWRAEWREDRILEVEIKIPAPLRSVCIRLRET